MHHLPLISHHLFVAAIANEAQLRPALAFREGTGQHASSPGRLIPLEVIEKAAAMPVAAARRLRAARADGGA